MRRNVLYLLVICFFSLLSCRNGQTVESLEGEWKSTDIELYRLILKEESKYVLVDMSASDWSLSTEAGTFSVEGNVIKLKKDDGKVTTGEIRRKDNLLQLVFGNEVFVRVADSERLYEDLEVPQLRQDLTSLDGEWFMTHNGPNRLIMNPDMSFIEINPCGPEYENELVVEGVYDISQGVLTLIRNDGSKLKGTIRDAGSNDICLDIEGYGWYVSIDPSDRTDIQQVLRMKHQWMGGTWSLTLSGNDRIVGHYCFHSTLRVDLQNGTAMMIDEDDREVRYNGSFTIQESDNRIVMGDLYVKYDPSIYAFYEDHGGYRTCYEKVSDDAHSNSRSYSKSQSASFSSSNTSFNHAEDVYRYLSSHRFRGSDCSVTFSNGGSVMCYNGNPITNAMEVISFSSHSAVLRYTSPYSPGPGRIWVDCQAGTV